MNIFQAVTLGIVQGLTEFLPVSSSGHLVFFQHVLGFKEPMLAFDVALHLGTLIAVFIFFRREIYGMLRDSILFAVRAPFAPKEEPLFEKYPFALLSAWVLLATLPAGLIAVFFKDAIEHLFGSLLTVSIAWMIMGVVLMLSRKFQSGEKMLYQITAKDSLFIGLIQGIAIIPGISRSGSTILAGLFTGLDREAAARFSFLISIPAVLGASLLELRHGVDFFEANAVSSVCGFLSAIVVGYLAIAILLRIVKKGSFFIFGFYCLFMGIISFIYLALHGFAL